MSHSTKEVADKAEPKKGKMVLKVHKIPKCDICLSNGHEKDAVYEAKTSFGPWAFLCQKCFDEVGISLKMELGRRLVSTEGDEKG